MTLTRCFLPALLLTVACSAESPDGQNTTTSSVVTGATTTTSAPPPSPTTSAPATSSQTPPPAIPPVVNPSQQPAPNPAPVTSAPVTTQDTSTAPETTTSEDTVEAETSSEAPASAPSSDDVSTAPEESTEPTPGGACVKGSTKGNEVVFIGESFIAASAIPEETTALAIQNGSLTQGDKYLDFSVSGTRMGDGAIPSQYTKAQQQNPIRFVLMNGGGNDCLQAGDPNSPIPAAEKLYAEMAADGVEKVVYFFYPDAAGSFGGPTSQLQTCLEAYRPKIKALCESLTAPKCYWLDLAETGWAGNEAAYTSDGIHPNGQGAKVTADEIWKTMVDNCVAQ